MLFWALQLAAVNNIPSLGMFVDIGPSMWTGMKLKIPPPEVLMMVGGVRSLC